MTIPPIARRQPGAVQVTAAVARAWAHCAPLGPKQDHGEGGYGFVSGDQVELQLGEVDRLDPTVNTSSCYLTRHRRRPVQPSGRAAGMPGRITTPSDIDYVLREGAYVDPERQRPVLRLTDPTQVDLHATARSVSPEAAEAAVKAASWS